MAYASLNQHDDAVRCYERAVQLEPENESYQSNLQIAEEKLRQTSVGAGADTPLAAGLGGLGGMPFDVGSLLNNPGTSLVITMHEYISNENTLFFLGLMNMAQQMLSNPSMQQLYVNQVSESSQA